jgi:DNA-binding MarR family transcriptional regulator
VTARLAAQPIPHEVLESLELLLFGAVGLTSVALTAAAAADLTIQQWRALVVIARLDSIGVGEVAARVGTTLPSASRLIGRLERRGLVATSRDEVDRRRTMVRTTPEGTATFNAVVARRRELMHAALAGNLRRLPTDLQGGLAALAQALGRYE